MMSISSTGLLAGHLTSVQLAESHAVLAAEGSFTAGAGVVLVLFLVAVLLLAVLVRGLALVTALLQPLFALLGSIALGIAAVFLLGAIALHNSGRLPLSPSTGTIRSTFIAPSHGSVSRPGQVGGGPTQSRSKNHGVNPSTPSPTRRS